MTKIIVFVLFNLIFVGLVSATILSVPSQYPSISVAVDAAQDGDTISIASGIYSETGSIVISEKSLSIITTSGLPDVVIRMPAPLLSMFNILNSSVSFADLELDGEGGNASCVSVTDSSVSLVAVNIYNCSTSNSPGGAIFSSGSSSFISADRCLFTNNSAMVQLASGIHWFNQGGAIYNEGRTNMSASTFTSNSAAIGGALYFTGAATVWNCTFVGNSVLQTTSTLMNGGAITNADGLTTVLASTFTSNVAFSGGAICNYGTIIVEDSSFFGNTVVGNAGGALYNSGSATLIGCALASNKAMRFGAGAIFNDQATLTLRNCSLSDNSVLTAGGAIVNSGILTVSFSSFTNNTSPGSGGAVYNTDRVKVVASCFKNNTAGRWGGAINGGAVVVEDSTFDGNRAVNGGAIYSPSATVNASTFDGNTAAQGGAIYIRDSVAISGSAFNYNKASSLGGAICSFGADNISSSVFYRNSAEFGGAIFASFGGFNAEPTIVTNSTFTSNNASSGGAIYTQAATSVNDSIFQNNTALLNGSALYNNGNPSYLSTLARTCCSFEGNTAQNGNPLFTSQADGAATTTVYCCGNQSICSSSENSALPDKHQLSGWQIGGIVLGSIAGIILFSVLGIWLYRRKEQSIHYHQIQ